MSKTAISYKVKDARGRSVQVLKVDEEGKATVDRPEMVDVAAIEAVYQGGHDRGWEDREDKAQRNGLLLRRKTVLRDAPR